MPPPKPDTPTTAATNKPGHQHAKAGTAKTAAAKRSLQCVMLDTLEDMKALE